MLDEAIRSRFACERRVYLPQINILLTRLKFSPEVNKLQATRH